MAKWLALLCSCLAISLVASGCGGDDEEEGGGGGGEAKQEEPAGGGGGGKSAEVIMSQVQFKPASVTVAKGGEVTWINDDSVGHDVTKEAGPGAAFKSGEAGGMAQGDTFSHTFDTAGEIEYVCTVHANMKGTVTIE